jgi:hypothetical protein
MITYPDYEQRIQEAREVSSRLHMIVYLYDDHGSLKHSTISPDEAEALDPSLIWIGTVLGG